MNENHRVCILSNHAEDLSLWRETLLRWQYPLTEGTIMKVFFAAIISVAILACEDSGRKDVKLETEKEKLSYAIGLNIGTNMHRDSVGVDPVVLLAGINDALTGDSSRRRMTDEEAQQAIMAFQQEMMARKSANAQLEGSENLKKGQAFLEENKKKEGVITLPSGLQYQVITEGKGRSPRENQTVTTNYRGMLINGEEFDSSYKRGEPMEFPLNRMISGWTEALQLMKVGSKWKLFVPPDLAYGEQGYGDVIGPNETLIFEIELLAIK